MTGPDEFWGGIEKYVFNPVLEAVNGYIPGVGLVDRLSAASRTLAGTGTLSAEPTDFRDPLRGQVIDCS